jgi:hypothetical protein
MDVKPAARPGDVIIVKVGGNSYETVIDKAGVQRFRKNAVLDHLFNSGRLDLNQLAIDYRRGAFDQRTYAEFNMALGYSVCGFAELSSFEDMEIENPLWSK